MREESNTPSILDLAYRYADGFDDLKDYPLREVVAAMLEIAQERDYWKSEAAGIASELAIKDGRDD